jgi:putative membrane protein
MSEVRRPRSVFGVGTDPDPRTSLANERTALAGLRTSLGLVVAGVGLAAITHLTSTPGWFQLIAIILCLMGAGLAVITSRQWVLVERALRLKEPLPSPSALPPLAFGIAVLAIATAIGIVLSALN